MKDRIHILIVEDHLAFAQGMELLLAQHEKVDQIYIATNRQNALELLKAKEIHIVILDLNFDTDKYDGFTIANKVKQLYPGIKVMILTQHARKSHHKRLFEECKVDAYLDKKLGVEETYLAINKVMNEEIYIDYSIEEMLEIEEWMTITVKQKQILEHVCNGLIQKQIADKMCISPKTVEVHIRKLFEKFKVKNTPELIAKYMRYKNANRDNVEATTPPFRK